ncbi:MAG: hypothetical protein ACYTG1_00420 [Planctomycetota bacterium]
MAAVLRVVLLSCLLGGAVGVGFWKIASDRKQRIIDELEALNAEMQLRLEEREAMIERLSRSRRLAHIRVTGQTRVDSGDVDETALEFIELDEQGTELARQTFTIPGDVLFVDYWTVKFDHAHIAEGHPIFGRTLVLLRRIYSDRMAPAEGFPIDTPGAVPPGYATTEVGTFEQRLWSDFWKLATEPVVAKAMGVRVAQGEAVYKPVLDGATYELLVDAAGGTSLVPLVDDEDDGGAATATADG